VSRITKPKYSPHRDTKDQEIHAVHPSPKLVPTKVSVLIEYLWTAFQDDNWPDALTVSADAADPAGKRRKV
jgi:hypothetical protein